MPSTRTNAQKFCKGSKSCSGSAGSSPATGFFGPPSPRARLPLGSENSDSRFHPQHPSLPSFGVRPVQAFIRPVATNAKRAETHPAATRHPSREGIEKTPLSGGVVLSLSKPALSRAERSRREPGWVSPVPVPPPLARRCRSWQKGEQTTRADSDTWLTDRTAVDCAPCFLPLLLARQCVAVPALPLSRTGRQHSARRAFAS